MLWLIAPIDSREPTVSSSTFGWCWACGCGTRSVTHLTFVPVSATSLRISLNRGTPFRKACLKGGARAVPAGGIANPHPGGFGTPLGRQKDRSAGSPLDWTSVRQAKLLPLPRSRKRGSGAESAGYGRFGECRGEAPEGERAPVWRASAPGHCRMATSDCVARTVDGMRLSALRLPRLYLRAANLGMALWFAKLGCGSRREKELSFCHCRT